jgi:DNA-binding helix-hairpin-helix protein with protein kinase domain
VTTTGDESLVGCSVRMVRAGTLVLVGRQIGQGGQGVVHEATIAGQRVALKWIRPFSRTAELRAAIGALTARERPHRAFAWPIDLVESDQIAGFGYIMPLVDDRFRSFAAMLNDRRQPSFRVMVAIGQALVDAFAALHAAGLCYRDISFTNLRVDPVRAEVAIIDNDNVGVDGENVFVKGTLRFMAPEIVRDDAVPSMVTDLYSLSVFLFHLFVHGHPLEGSRTDATYGWSDGHMSETKLARRHFGEEPLFVFDPQDSSNRPLPGDPMIRWWWIYPRFLRALFERAFTVGLRDASLSGRLTEGVWRRALARLGDCVSVCPSCRAAIFWDPDDPELPCWQCGVAPPPPTVLELARHRLVLAEGATITGYHFAQSRDNRRTVGVVEAHPSETAERILRNVSATTWIATTGDQGVVSVEPTQSLWIRPMAVNFGDGAGQIVVASRRDRP